MTSCQPEPLNNTSPFLERGTRLSLGSVLTSRRALGADRQEEEGAGMKYQKVLLRTWLRRLVTFRSRVSL